MKISKTLPSLLIAIAFLITLVGSPLVRAGSTVLIFHKYDTNEAWETNPQYMTDGNENTYASTSIDGDVQLLTESVTDGGTLSIIEKVEIRAKGKYSGSQAEIFLRPVFDGTTDGDNYTFDLYTYPTWSQWFDITDDNAGPGEYNWTMDDVNNLDIDVEANLSYTVPPTIVYCSKVEMRITGRY